MSKISFLLLLISCSPYHMFKKNKLVLSESACVDGTIVNIAEAGCENYYWGSPSSKQHLKLRCTYSKEDNFWTEMDFYAVPHSYENINPDWGTYCEDKYVRMYALPRGSRLESKE